MTEALDNLLQTGQWSTSRAKSPGFETQRIRPNQGVKLGSNVPRSLAFDSCGPLKKPQPPFVEEEADSLAREYGPFTKPAVCPDEEPKFPGDVDQQPILETVHEFNPERRYVLVPHDHEPKENLGQPRGDPYMANTGRKVTSSRTEGDSHGVAPPPATEVKRRKSRLDLPRLNTAPEATSRSSSTHRPKSDVQIDQKQQSPPDTSTSQKPSDQFLSPSVFKHSTNGRDRLYQDFSRPANGNRASEQKRQSEAERRVFHHEERSNREHRERRDRLTPSASPATQRRSNSAVEPPEASRRPSSKRTSRDEYEYSPRTSRGSVWSAAPSGRDNRPPTPPRIHRRASSPKRYYAHEPRHSRSPMTPRYEDRYSSDEDLPRYRPTHERRKSQASREDYHHVSTLSPNITSPTARMRSRSRTTTPLVSPRASQGYFPEVVPPMNPRSSATFPTSARERREPRPSSPLPSPSSSPRDGPRMSGGEPPRPRSRAPSFNASAAAGAAAIALAAPAVMPSFPESPVDRRRSPVPPRSRNRQDAPDAYPASPPWQPPVFTPADSGVSLEKPIVSYRRYSEDVNKGGMTGMPDCPRTIPQTGRHDWLTLPRCDTFNVCPSCYNAVFVNTDFQHKLVLAPFRPMDKSIACDLGTSPWFRIAWLMTKKYNIPDLRFIKGIADVVARYPECPSYEQRVLWHTVIDPRNNQPVPDFRVCPGCANSVETLFPNLMGVMRPLTRPDVELRPCSLHFTPDMKKFVEYFDALEVSADIAVASNTAPDVAALAQRLRKVVIPHECPRDEPVQGRQWFYPAELPRLTVCEDCFWNVVRPEIDALLPVAMNFIAEPKPLARADCKLYSDRMRRIFRQACRRDGLGVLKRALAVRDAKEAEIGRRLHELDSEPRSTSRQAEIRRLDDEWKLFE